MLVSVRRSLAALLTSALLAGCSGGNVASELAKAPEFQPKGETKCGVTKSQARPLIVEWPSSDRAALEARVKQGLVAVRYQGCEMEVLTRCSGPGSYGYTGITPKSDKITMKDSDELYANIPVYAAKFESKLQKSGALNVAMTIVGRWDASRGSVHANELKGECAEATHLVTALTVGAFEFFAGSEAEVGAGATIAGAGAGAKSAAERETLNRDGEATSCQKAAENDKTPPFGCGALLRLEVVPINKDDAPVEVASAKKPDAPPVASVAPVASVTPPAPGKASTSTCLDAPACEGECKQGNAAACTNLGSMYRDGKGATKDANRAQGVLRQACDGGSLKGCVLLGEMHYQGIGMPKDGTGAAELFKKACDADELTGCVDLAWVYDQGFGAKKDSVIAASFFAKACNDRSAIGCVGLGMLARDGRNGPKDVEKARGYFKKACDAGVGVGCQSLNGLK
jgi:TPR repeat protein